MGAAKEIKTKAIRRILPFSLNRYKIDEEKSAIFLEISAILGIHGPWSFSVASGYKNIATCLEKTNFPFSC